MTVRPRHYVLFCGLVPTLIVVVLSLSRPALLGNLDYGAYDTLLRLAGTKPTSGRITIVDVDERSLAQFGQWPWRRDLIAGLIDRLRGLGASAVGLDIMFAEPDRQPAGGTDTDRVLAGTLGRGRVVLGYAMMFDPASAPPACAPHPISLPLIQRGGDDAAGLPYFQATGAICNLPVLTGAAAAAGFLNAAPDPDGLLRRAPLLIELDGAVYPSLALAVVSMASGVRPSALRVLNVNTASLALGDRAIPLDGKSNVMLRYRGERRTFPFVSAADVLGGSAGAGQFQNRIVLVGTTALGTREVVATPLDTLFTGVEVQATIADNLLQGDVIHRPEYRRRA